MGDETYILTEGNEAEAQKELRELLQRPGWFTLITLGNGAGADEVFAQCASCCGSQLTGLAAWAKEPGAIKPVLDDLVGHEKVRYGENGSWFVAIDRNDEIQVAYNENRAKKPVWIFLGTSKVVRV